MIEARLPIWAKIRYGMADTGINVFVIIKGLIVADFLVSYLNVSASVASWVLLAVLAFDIVTDPVVGWLSDRTQTRWGKRAPYMVVGALAMSILLVLMFAVPETMRGTAAALWVGGFFAAASLAWTMVVIPYGTLAIEMTNSPQERSTLTGFRMAGASIGILLAGAVFPILIGVFGGSTAAFVMTMAVFTPVAIMTIWLAATSAARYQGATPKTDIRFWEQFELAFSNKQFVTLVLIYGFQTIAIAFITAGIPFAAKYLALNADGGPMPEAQTLIFGAFVVGALSSQVIWVYVSRALGKRQTYMLGIVLYVLVLVLVFLSLPTANSGLLIAVMILAGLTNGCYQQLPWAIMPDLVSITHQETGKAADGFFSAFWLFGQKVANAIGPFAFLTMIAAFGWVSTDQGYIQQSQLAVNALHWGMTLVPALILALSVPLYWALSKEP